KRHAVTGTSPLRRIVSTRFQVLFHSPPGVLFTFPSRYWSTIGHQGVFRLRRWSSQIHTGFFGPRATWDPARKSAEFRLRGCPPLCRRFPERLGLLGRVVTAWQLSSFGVSVS